MDNRRRRPRKTDLLASRHAVRRVLANLRDAIPGIIPIGDEDLLALLRAARHVQRYSATDTKAGRPGRWERQDLLKVLDRLSEILDRETVSHISPSSFIDHYLRLLRFPVDTVEALEHGEINLFEAAQFARIPTGHSATEAFQADRLRADLLASHIRTKESGDQLRRRVNELLSASSDSNQNLVEAKLEDNFEDFDPYDATHLFWEQLKQLGFAFREIRREDLTDAELEQLLTKSEPIMALLTRILRRKEHKKVVKLQI